MAQRTVSQKTIVAISRVLRDFNRHRDVPLKEYFYENEFEDFFVVHAETHYEWNWLDILINLRSGQFFFPEYGFSSDSILGEFLEIGNAQLIGEYFIGKLAAISTTLPCGDNVLRSLHLDGFDVNREKTKLVTLEGPVSTQQEEDSLTVLVKTSGLPNSATVLTHMSDAHALFMPRANITLRSTNPEVWFRR